jgi:hypothetical protein
MTSQNQRQKCVIANVPQNAASSNGFRVDPTEKAFHGALDDEKKIPSLFLKTKGTLITTFVVVVIVK